MGGLFKGGSASPQGSCLVPADRAKGDLRIHICYLGSWRGLPLRPHEPVVFAGLLKNPDRRGEPFFKCAGIISVTFTITGSTRTGGLPREFQGTRATWACAFNTNPGIFHPP